MKKISTVSRGALIGLLYGMITMFPEWLIYVPGNSALSIGSFLNLPAFIFIPSQGFGMSDVITHYLILLWVLVFDACLFALVTRIFFNKTP